MVAEDEDKYVLKLYRDRTYISNKYSATARAMAEYHALKLCEENQVTAPIPVFWSGNTVLMTFVDGNDLEEVDIEPYKRLCLTLKWLNEFHRIQNCQKLSNIDPCQAALSTLEYSVCHKEIYGVVEKLLISIKSLSIKASLRSALGITHGDPTLHNWMMCNGELYGLDFEFCGLNDPLFDIGMLLATNLELHNFDHSVEDKLKREAFQACRIDSESDQRDVDVYISIGLILMGLNITEAERRDKLLKNALEKLN
jgi:thiamine kinase-like enzyme